MGFGWASGDDASSYMSGSTSTLPDSHISSTPTTSGPFGIVVPLIDPRGLGMGGGEEVGSTSSSISSATALSSFEESSLTANSLAADAAREWDERNTGAGRLGNDDLLRGSAETDSKSRLVSVADDDLAVIFGRAWEEKRE